MVRNSHAAQALTIAILTVVTALAYSNSFQGAFTLDDFVNILNSQGIRQFQPTVDGIVAAATDEPNGDRWLANLSFALNFYIHGEETWGYHLVNLLVHLAGAVVLYFLCLTTLTLPPNSGRFSAPHEIALFTSLLWAVHPLQTNGVTYIVQRMTAMSSLFYLAALLCYVRGRLGGRVGIREVLLFALSLLFWLMAITSKENAYMFPVMVLCYELFFLGKDERRRFTAKTALLLACSVGIVLLGCVLFLGPDIFSSLLEMYRYRDFTPGERLLTQSRVIFLYLSLIALPLPSRLNLNHEMVVSQGILVPPQTLASILGILVLIILIPALFNRNRILSFGILWFLGNLVIESTVLPLELVYEHRLYLPTTFLFLGLAATCSSLLRNNPWIFLAVCAIFICLFSLWTWQRNLAWKDNLTLWSDVVRKSPTSARAYNNLGTVYHELGKFGEAEGYFRQAIRLDPEARQAYVSLGHLFISLSRYQEAMQLLQAGLARQQYLNPARIYHYMGVIYSKTGRNREAVASAEQALQLNPEDIEPMITLGIAYGNTGEVQKADSIFMEAEQLGLTGTNLYNNWGTVAFKMGDLDRSVEYFRKALEFDPDHPESHYNLGLAYGAKGMVDEARKEMLRSMELRQQPLIPEQ